MRGAHSALPPFRGSSRSQVTENCYLANWVCFRASPGLCTQELMGAVTLSCRSLLLRMDLPPSAVAACGPLVLHSAASNLGMQTFDIRAVSDVITASPHLAPCFTWDHCLLPIIPVMPETGKWVSRCCAPCRLAGLLPAATGAWSFPW